MQSSIRNGGRAPSALSLLLSIGCKSIAVSAAALILAACGAKPNARVVGAWELSTHNLAFQLSENGTGLMEAPLNKVPVIYTMPDAKTVILDIDNNAQKMILHYTDQGTLVDSTTNQVYSRVAALPQYH